MSRPDNESHLMREQRRNKILQILILMFMLVSVSACSVIDNFLDVKKSKLNYKNNASVKPLDFPPDLTAPEFDTAFELPTNGVVSASAMGKQSGGFTASRRQVNVPTRTINVQLGKAGSTRWLDVDAPTEIVWPRIRDFWRSIEIPVKRDEPRLGVMETEWVVNKTSSSINGWLNKTIDKVMGKEYDSGSSDRYIARIEKPTATTTRIFLIHKNVEKVETEAASDWKLRPTDENKQAEMLNRLKAYLQSNVVATARNSTPVTESAQTASLANIVTQDGLPVLQIQDNYKRSWVLTGIMLDRMGLVAEKRNQAAGIYDVRYQGEEQTAKRGFFGRMFGGRKTLLTKGEDYKVLVQGGGMRSVVRIMDKTGKPLNKNLSQRVLVRLKKEFDR